MELAPFLTLNKQSKVGCQGFIGPLPSAFLDKYIIKNWCKYNGSCIRFPNEYYKRDANRCL